MRGHIILVCCYAALGMAAIYAPQPLLPLLARDLFASQAAVSLLVTVTLLPLGLAPLGFGLWLETLPARKLLLAAVALLGLSGLGLAVTPNYETFLGLRLGQGLLIPALLTSLMTLMAGLGEPAAIGRRLSLYVSATIVGGVLGRLFSGFTAQLLGWRSVFTCLGLMFLVGLPLLARLPDNARKDGQRTGAKALIEVLAQSGPRRVCLLIFCCFFVFAAMCNGLPFRLVRLSPGLSSGAVGLAYSGYVMGMLASLLAPRLAWRFGGDRRAVCAGVLCHLASLALFLPSSLALSYGAMFVFCAGMFWVHALAPGILHRLAPGRTGVANGLYISFYYSGGTLGTLLPGLVYDYAGWHVFVACLAAMLFAALWLALGLPSEPLAEARQNAI